MNERIFMKLVHDMRHAQKQFFATRKDPFQQGAAGVWLKESKRLERMVDAEIDKVFNPPAKNQLF